LARPLIATHFDFLQLMNEKCVALVNYSREPPNRLLSCTGRQTS